MNPMIVLAALRETLLEIKDLEGTVIQLDAPLDAFGFDSLDLLEIQLMVLQRFGVALEPEAFQGGVLKTCGDLIDLVVRQTNMRAASAD